MTMRERCTTATTIKATNGWLTWFWTANLPPVLAAYLLLGNDAFQRVMLLYLAVVSIWANVASHAAAWVAGRTDVRLEEQQT